VNWLVRSTPAKSSVKKWQSMNLLMSGRFILIVHIHSIVN
jgi:hypothetical protein